MQLKIMWMSRSDMEAVLDLELLAFGGEPRRWGAEEYELYCCMPHTMSVVVKVGEFNDVVGVMLYTLETDRIVVHRIVVHPGFRRRGIGQTLLDQIERKICDRREVATCQVDEKDLELQLFLAGCGWRAKSLTGGVIRFELSLADLGQQVLQRIAEGNVGVMVVGR
jgi:ribosomal protein S18 acetylase RimI-like enzyme